MNRKIIFMLAGLTVFCLASANFAQEANVDGMSRAGNPQNISPLARPSIAPGSLGYYVGGGALSAHRGEQPTADDGTWGWDYRGLLVPRKVNLLWWHGRRTQGGTGAYKTDGPKLPALRESGD